MTRGVRCIGRGANRRLENISFYATAAEVAVTRRLLAAPSPAPILGGFHKVERGSSFMGRRPDELCVGDD